MGASPKRQPNVIYLFSDEHVNDVAYRTAATQDAEPGAARREIHGVHPLHQQSRARHTEDTAYGALAARAGVVDNNLPLSQNEQTVGKVFQSAGWRTGYIGKWHLGGTRAEPFGFDHSLIWEKTNTHWDTSEFYPSDNKPVKPNGYNATLMTDQALPFIEENRARPFCLFVSLNPPHANFTDAPEAKKALYPEGSLPRRPNWREAKGPASTPDAKFFSNNGWPYYEGIMRISARSTMKWAAL